MIRGSRRVDRIVPQFCVAPCKYTLGLCEQRFRQALNYVESMGDEHFLSSERF